MNCQHDYVCLECGFEFSLSYTLTGEPDHYIALYCPHCGTADLVKASYFTDYTFIWRKKEEPNGDKTIDR